MFISLFKRKLIRCLIVFCAIIFGRQEVFAATNLTNEKYSKTQKASLVHLVTGHFSGGLSQGIYHLAWDSLSNSFDKPQLLVKTGGRSYFAIDNKNRRIYTVGKLNKQGAVFAYSYDDNFALTAINSQLSEGSGPCHLSLNSDNSQLAVANYSSGNIAVFNLNKVSGEIQGSPQTRQHSGKGPHPKRQTQAHAHWVGWGKEDKFVYAVDLGIDKVMAYPVLKNSTLGQGFTALQSRPGAGPRHMAFHPKKSLIYVLNELSNTVTVAKQKEDGSFQQLQTINTLPEQFEQYSKAAHLYVDSKGKHLYASNRGHNSIAVFSIDDKGLLKVIQIKSTLGDSPRVFLVSEEHQKLFVANQNSGDIQVLNINQDGTLEATKTHIKMDKTVFLGTIN